MKLIIGISGKISSGKDTIAEYLINQYGFEKHGMADAMKEACKYLFGFSAEQLHGDKKEIVDDYWKVTPRYVLQKMGTEMFREQFTKVFDSMKWVKEDFWIWLWLRWFEIREDNPVIKIVIPDIRFENEEKMIKNLNSPLTGGIKTFLIRVERDIERLKDVAEHSSENGIDDYQYVDHVIINDGTIEELQQKVWKLYEGRLVGH